MPLVNINYERLRWPLVLLSLLQIGMSSGMMYGFASLRIILGNYNIHEEIDLITLGQMGIMAVALSQFLSGLLLDLVGPNRCSGICMLLLALGTFLLSFGLQYPNVLYVACILIGLCGPGTQVSTIHLSALFPRNRGSVVSLQIGAFQVSCLLFLFIKYLVNLGLSFQTLLIVLANFQMALGIASFIVWPMKPFGVKSVPNDSKNQPSVFQFRIARGTKAVETRKSLMSQMLTSSYFGMALFLPIVMFYLNSFMVLTKEQISNALGVTAGDDKLQLFTDLSQLLLLCGVVANVFFGIVIDRFGIVKSAFLVMMLLFGYSVALLFSMNRIRLLLTALILFPIGRSCFFSWAFFVLSVDFGYQNFGMLAGVLFLINALIFLTHGVLFRSLFSADIVAWNISQLIMIIMMLAFPIYWMQRRISHRNRCNKQVLDV